MKHGIISLGLLSALLSPSVAQDKVEPTDGDDLVTIEGNVSRSDTGVLYINFANREFEVKSVKRPCQDDLNNLQTGDHLVGLGRVQAIKKLIWLDEVEMVGVERVLGEWDDQNKKKRFDFRDFTSLDVSDLAKIRGQSLNYRLVPDKKDEWTIFLSTNTNVKVGTMRYSPERMRLEVIDMKTGKISEQYNLTNTAAK